MINEKLLSIQDLLKKKEILGVEFSKPAPMDSIDLFKTNRSDVPTQYRDLLSTSNGIRNLWNNFNFVGTEGFDLEIKHILEVEEEFLLSASEDYLFSLNIDKEFQNWEKRTVQYHVPHYFIFATDMKDQIIFFNQFNKNENGEEEVVVWHKEKGAIMTFDNLYSFLDFIINKLSEI